LSTSDETVVAQRMEQAIRRYYAACNTGDVDAVAAFFTPDAVHYVPPGYGGSPRGGRAIGEVIARLVQATASRWSIDQVVCDPGTNRAVIEWTVRRTGALARGAEWYEFDPGYGTDHRDPRLSGFPSGSGCQPPGA
jgi:methyltransferase